MKLPVFATAAEIRAIYARTTEAIDATYDLEGAGGEESDDALDLSHMRASGRRMDYLLDALRFCAAAAAVLRDPALGDIVIGCVEQLGLYDDDAASHRWCAHRAAGDMLAAGHLDIDAARALAQSPHADLREEIAESLSPRIEPHRALLESLAADPVAAVRKAAKEALGAGVEIPWWHGKWRADPEATLLPAEAEAVRPALAHVGAILDRQPYVLFARENSLVPELLDELAKLPAPLAVEAIELCCAGAQGYYVGDAAPLLARMLALPGGIDAFERLVDRWGKVDRIHYVKSRLAVLVKAQPDPVRAAVCERLLAIAAAAPWAERRVFGQGRAWLAAALLGEAWLPSADVTPLLDALLAFGRSAPPKEQRTEPHEMDRVRSELAGALKLEGVDPAPVLDRLCEARAAGYPGEWDGLDSHADALLERAPRDMLRRTAERALDASEDAATQRWAAAHLLGAGFDPALDGPPDARAAALFASPRLRAALFRDPDLVDRAVPALRDQLRAGALSYDEAARVVAAIDRLHGGIAEGVRDPEMESSPPEERRRAAREAASPFLGPPESQVPVTEAEWEALAIARRAAGDDPPEGDSVRWARLLRAGPWTPAERADLDVYVEAFRGGDVDLSYPLGLALLAKPEPELAPLMEEILSRAHPSARRLLMRLRAPFYEAVGREPPPEEALVKPAKPAGETSEADESDGWGDDESDDLDEDGDDEES